MNARAKIVLLGEIGVGKTSLIRRFVTGKFSDEYRATFGFALYNSIVTGVGENSGETRDVVIWDTDGNHASGLVAPRGPAAGAAAALIVGEVGRPETIDIMVELASAYQENHPRGAVVFVLNKHDLVEGHGALDAPARLTEFGVPIVKSSAKTGDGVQAVFVAAINAAMRRGELS